MMLGSILLTIFILLLILTVPVWPYSSEWGYYPSSIIGFLIAILLLLILLDILPFYEKEIIIATPPATAPSIGNVPSVPSAPSSPTNVAPTNP